MNVKLEDIPDDSSTSLSQEPAPDGTETLGSAFGSGSGAHFVSFVAGVVFTVILGIPYMFI